MPETYSTDTVPDLSIVLPAHNEHEAVGGVVREVREALCDWPGTWEILVVDDASTDGTAEVAQSAGVRVLRRTQNGGSGAARKTGVREAHADLIAMLDPDGSYDPAHLPELLSFFPAYDQVNGARTSEQGSAKLMRVPVKWCIRKLAEWISGQRIPDLNTGMKVFKRDLMLRYLWAVPDGFSCVSSMTLAFLCNGHSVRFVPVTYRKRIGHSKFRPVRDTLSYAATVLRMIMYFRPLRVFVPLACGTGAIAVVKGAYNIVHSPLGLHDSDVILAVSALIVLVIGLLADLIVARGDRAV